MIIFKYNDLVNIDVRARVEKTDTLFEAGAAVVGVYSLKAIVFVIPASVLSRANIRGFVWNMIIIACILSQTEMQKLCSPTEENLKNVRENIHF